MLKLLINETEWVVYVYVCYLRLNSTSWTSNQGNRKLWWQQLQQ